MMWWCSPNITQFPFTSPGTGQHLICWFYTCKNNCCLLVAQQSISGESGGNESGGGVNSLIPQSPNTPLPNRKVNILTSAWGRQAENPTLCRSSTHSMNRRSGIPFWPWVISLIIPASHAWVCCATSSRLIPAALSSAWATNSFLPSCLKVQVPTSVYRVTPFE